MDCPVCKKTMADELFGAVKVQVCEDGCQGIWFDCGELAKLDEANEGLGKALQTALAAPRRNDADRAALDCPNCGVPMHRHVYASEKEINVDECYVCGGFFLDSGELKPIRDNHMSEAEESAYLQKLLDDQPVYAEAKRKQHAEELRLKALHRLTRFLRLSYYMPGHA